MKILGRPSLRFRSLTVAIMTLVMFATSTLAASAPQKQVPKLPQEKLLKQCAIPIDPDFDPASLAALYNSGQVSTADMQKFITDKLVEWGNTWATVQNDPYLKYQAEVNAAKCMSDAVRSIDQVVVKEWQTLDKQSNKTAETYISGLTTQAVQTQLVRLHKALVDRNMPELATSGKPTTADVDSFDEKYLKLAATAQSRIDNKDTTSPDMFPYMFAAINADLLNGMSLDYGWQLSAATAYLSLPAYDALLLNAQFLGQALQNHFYNTDNGDLSNKQKYPFAADVNVPYSISTLDYSRHLIGDYVDYAKNGGQKVTAELGGARYDRANAILYARYIVLVQKAYRVKTYTEIEKAAADLYKRVNALKDKKAIVESTYFVLALQTLMTPYMADGTLTSQEVTQLVKDLEAFAKIVRGKDPVALADYYNTLFGYEVGSDEYITPVKLVEQMVDVMKQLFGEDVAKIATDAARDGKISAEERAAIWNAIMKTTKGNALIVNNAKLYMKTLQAVLVAPYEGEYPAQLGNYNAVYYGAVNVDFPDGSARPVYVPKLAKFEVPPMGALRKGVLDTVTALRVMMPIARQQTEDAKIVLALKKFEDMKVLMPLLAGATQDYVKANKEVIAKEGPTAFVNGLITVWYQTASGYKTPALTALYEVKVNGKSLNDVLKAMVPAKPPVNTDRVLNVLNALSDVFVEQAF